MQDYVYSKRAQKAGKKKQGFYANLYNLTFLLPAFWLVLGAIEIFSSSRYASELINHSKVYLLSLHLLWIVFGLIVAFVFANIPKKTVMKLSGIMYVLNVLLLIFTFINGQVNGASRWVSFLGFTIQPSEFLKVVLPIFLANNYFNQAKSSARTYVEHLKQDLVPLLMYVIVPFGLVFLQPDLSTLALLILEVGIMYLLSNNKYILQDILFGVIGILAFLGLAIGFTGFRKTRMQVYLTLLKTGEIIDPYGAGNQILNILIAVGSGGLLGKGIGHSSQIGGYLVESTAVTDSIGAVMFEELGFFAGSLIVISFVIWGIYTINQIIKSSNLDSYAIALIAIVSVLTVQALSHFAVNVALFPLTGIALPFMSYGGSFTMVSLWSLGLLFRFFKDT